MTTQTDLLADAAKYLGYEEGKNVDGSHNNDTTFGRWAGANRQPWCCAFTSFVEDESGVGIGRIVYCPTALAYYRNAERLFSTPQVGDQFFIYFPSMGRYAHTGFVSEVRGDYFKTIEGNSNNDGSRDGKVVCSNVRRWRGTRTVFGRPAYSQAQTPVTPPVQPPVVQPQAGGALAVDGDFGPQTVKALQRVLHVNVDGDFGPQTKKALQAYLHVAVDGAIGPNTIKALQSKVGAMVDGSWGRNTTMRLQMALNNGHL